MDAARKIGILVFCMVPAIIGGGVVGCSVLYHLTKLGWTDVLPEYDPFKYNSFPIEAGEQIYDLTMEVNRRIAARLDRGGELLLPPLPLRGRVARADSHRRTGPP